MRDLGYLLCFGAWTVFVSTVSAQAPTLRPVGDPKAPVKVTPAKGMNEAVCLARDDAKAHKALAYLFRYFYLPDEVEDAKENIKTLRKWRDFYSRWPDWLSRDSDIGTPKMLSPNLIRINIKDYRWNPKVWERLVDVDPWFHSRVIAEKKRIPVSPDESDQGRAGVDGGGRVGAPVRAALPPGPDPSPTSSASFVYVWDNGFHRVSVSDLKSGQEAYDKVGEASYSKLSSEEVARRIKGSSRTAPTAPKDVKEAIEQDKALPLKKRPDTLPAGPRWIDGLAYGELVDLTQTQVPMVWGAWFFKETSQAEDRIAGYYDWFEVGKDQADFDRLVGANIELSREIRKVHRGVVGRSTVAFNNRGMEGGATITEGVRFLTEDYLRSVDTRNAFRLLLGDAEPDGGEGLGNLANGLIFMWVQNGKRKRLDAVPPNIAGDKTSTSPNFEVHAGKCMRCHKEGFKPIGDWARKTYVAPFSLDSPEYELQRRLRAAHLSQLEKFIAKGNRTYADALEKIGYTPQSWSEAFGEAVDRYENLDVDIPMLARFWSVPTEFMTGKLKAEAERGEKGIGKKIDPVYASMLQGLSARIEWIEELNPQTYEILMRP